MSNQPSCITLRFPGSPAEVRGALRRIRAAMLAAGADPGLTGRTESVLGEVLNNVVEHALPQADCDLVEVSGEQVAGGWRFHVRDMGPPLPNGQPPDPGFPELATTLDNLPEGGFGWAMVQALAHDLTYERRAGQNRLGFLVPF